MTITSLYTKINALPLELIKEVDEFIDNIYFKQKNQKPVKEREFGCAKNLFVLHDDFDSPLEDFKEYM